MKEFLKEYKRRIYGRELVGKVPISEKNVALTLIELEKEGILVYETSGNRKYYSLNFSNPLIGHYIMLFEGARKIEFLERNKSIVDFLNSLEGEIVCVFGSYAKDVQKKGSDLDILIVGEANSGKIIREGEKYRINVQVFSFSFDSFKDSLKNKSALIKEVLGSHVLIKGSEKFVEEVIKWTS